MPTPEYLRKYEATCDFVSKEYVLQQCDTYRDAPRDDGHIILDVEVMFYRLASLATSSKKCKKSEATPAFRVTIERASLIRLAHARQIFLRLDCVW